MKSLKITPSPKNCKLLQSKFTKICFEDKVIPQCEKTLKYLKKKLNFLLLHLKIKLELNFY